MNDELLALDETGLDAAVRECARITRPEISDDEFEQIKADNSPRYQNTRTEMGRAIRAYLRAAKPALSSIVTCCVTGAIPGDGGACGDCDPCLFSEASLSSPVKRLIAEKNSLLHRIGELEDKLAEALPASGATTKSDGGGRTAPESCPNCFNEDDCANVDICNAVNDVYRPSDPSSTRSDVTVEAKHLVSSARAFLAHFDPCDLAEDKSQQWQSLEHQCNRVERALLDNPQFEIRRK